MEGVTLSTGTTHVDLRMLSFSVLGLGSWIKSRVRRRSETQERVDLCRPRSDSAGFPLAICGVRNARATDMHSQF